MIVLTGNRVGEEIVVVDEAVLGRLAECDLHIEDKLASRRHAKVRVDPQGVYLEDLGSSNGTRLHDERVREARLEDGDEFEIGHVRIRVRLQTPHGEPVHKATPTPPPSSPLASASSASAPPAPDAFEEIQLEGLEEEIELEAREEPASPAPPARPTKASPVSPPVAPRSRPAAGRPAGSVARPDGTVKPGAAKAQRGKGGALQYNRVEDRGGLLGEDLWQRSGLSRILILVVVLAVGAGLFVLAYHSVS